MAHMDRFLWLSVRSTRRSDAAHRKPRATQSESLRNLPCRLSPGTFGGRRKALPMGHIACGSSPARRSLETIPRGHKHRSLVLS